MQKPIVFSSMCVCLGAALLLESAKIRPLWSEPMGPAVFPRVLACLLILAAGGELVLELLAARKEAARQGVPPRGGASRLRGLFRAEDGRTLLAVGYMAAISLLYIFGLAYIGFYVSTAIYILASVGGLCYFSQPEAWLKKALKISIPMLLLILGALAAAHRYMHIYFPSKGILW